MKEGTLQAVLRTVNEQSPFTCHISNTHLIGKSFDIYAIHKLTVVDKIFRNEASLLR